MTEQPFGLFLFWIEEYLRLIAGVSREYEEFKGEFASALCEQHKEDVSISKAFYMVQALAHSMLPPSMTSELFHSLDFTMSGSFELADEYSEVLALLQVNSRLLASTRMQCSTCPRPANCRTRGSPLHSSVDSNT
jgi:hypothetical protein